MNDMSPKPILFVSESGSGVFNVMLTIAGELARRGTPDVWLATNDNRRAQVEAVTEGEGVRFASLGPPDPDATLADWPEKDYRSAVQRSRWRAHRSVVRYEFLRSLRAPVMDGYPVIEAVIDEVRPALMVIDVVHSLGIAAAMTKGVPYILSSPVMPSNQLFLNVGNGFPMLHTGLPLEMTARQRLYNTVFKLRAGLMFLHPTMLRAARRIRVDALRHGISPEAGKVRSKVDLAELLLCYTVFGLEYPFELPANVRLLGAVIPPLPEAPAELEISAWLDRHDSVVYAGFGTLWRPSADDVRALVEVFRRLGGRHHVLWKLPRSQHHLLPPDLPANLRVESWLPSQLDVLAHPAVKVFLNHGGANGFHESLYFGKPMVVRPLWVDCYDQAVRAVTSGVGLCVDRPDIVDVDDTVTKLEQVLDEPRFRRRAEHFASELRLAGGRDAAADLILASPALK